MEVTEAEFFGRSAVPTAASVGVVRRAAPRGVGGECSSTRLRLRRCPETHSRHTLAHGSAQTAYLCRPDAVIHPDEQDVTRRAVRAAGERHEQPER